MISLYFILNLLYSIKLKHYSVVDICIVASGFVIRIFVGGMAVGIVISQWIIIMTFLLALFLATAKRRNELELLSTSGAQVRSTISRYSEAYLEMVMGILATVIIVCYIIYTTTPGTLTALSNYLYMTVIFVLLGLLRYLQLAIVDHKTGSPSRLIWSDTPLLASIVMWVISYLVIIY